MRLFAVYCLPRGRASKVPLCLGKASTMQSFVRDTRGEIAA